MREEPVSSCCACCGRRFRNRPQNPDQKYCPRRSCQNERRRRWRRAKLRHDPDYRANQHDSQKRWAKFHPDYYRQWRARHPEYVNRNRSLQRERDRLRRDLATVADSGGVLAKSDACPDQLPVLTAYYELLPAKPADLAKSDASKRLFRLIPAGCADNLVKDRSCKEITRGTLRGRSDTTGPCSKPSP